MLRIIDGGPMQELAKPRRALLDCCLLQRQGPTGEARVGLSIAAVEGVLEEEFEHDRSTETDLPV